MNRNVPTVRRPRATLTALLAVLATLAALALLVPGSAQANHGRGGRAVPPPPANPTRADQIQNIDQVKTAIKAYYGDTVSGTNPDGTPQHLPSPTSAYAAEMHGIEANAQHYLAQRARHQHAKGTKAILLDVDDTSLNTYNYEIFSNFVYNPASNATFVNGEAFPAVFGMPDLVAKAQAKGYKIFFLTGRPETQRAATDGNLTKVGYPVVDSQVYLKDQTKPWLASCAPSCTTIQYKSLTRRYIESQGYDIVANFGDQYSDLSGGYADKDYKLPNPMYYLP
ncbi:HAD family acid phosphatase [uncultured Jatrophihabitans sp.]|uniref:HAD family acid phosphatase n=1 Tax=uncultured Jatrophihabitans sp. TaxID=1610747 RepID=UPI0035CC139F